MSNGPNYHTPFKPETDRPFNLNPYELEQWTANQWVRDYRNFNEMPAHKLTESALVAWVCEGGKFHQIRREYWSEPLLYAAVRRDPDAFKLIGEDDIDDHRMLSFECVKAGCLQFKDLLPAYQDESFVLDLIEPYAYMVEGIDFAHRFKHLLTDRVIDAICRKSVDHAYEFACRWCPVGKFRINDDSIKAAIAVNATAYFRLAEMGKEHVLVSMLADGFWPSTEFFVRDSPSRYPPSSATEAFERYSKSLGMSNKALHVGWLKTRPTSELVDALQGSQEALGLLFDIVPKDDLRDLMKTHRSIRGRFLEYELGM